MYFPTSKNTFYVCDQCDWLKVFQICRVSSDSLGFLLDDLVVFSGSDNEEKLMITALSRQVPIYIDKCDFDKLGKLPLDINSQVTLFKSAVTMPI